MSNKKSVLPDHSISAQDVASAVGVSQSTVSRVLNNKDDSFISDSTRDRVLKKAKELGYVPNPLARALRQQKTHLIGIVVREIDDHVFTMLVSHLSMQLRDLGYHLVLVNAQSDPREALQMGHMLDSRQVEGLVIIGDLPNGQEELLQLIRTNRVVISLFRQPGSGTGTIVTVDNEIGIQLSLQHLFDLGHEKIGFLGYDWLDDTKLRQQEFETFMRASGKIVDRQWIGIGVGGVAGGYSTMRKILLMTSRPTAVVACDDGIAIGAISALSDMSIEVPQEMSIIGFDDIRVAQYVTPPLSTVRMPVQAISDKVCQLLMQFINSGETPPNLVHKIMPELIVRKSTGRFINQ